MSAALNVIRSEILNLSAYTVADAQGMLKLDAMENPYRLPEALQLELATRLAQLELNRYPIPTYTHLKTLLSTQCGIPAGYPVVLGNGSDELITLLTVACAKPHAKVLAPVPTFVMYEMAARLAGMEFVGVPLNDTFQLDFAAMMQAIEQHKPALSFLSYPNNPTGTLFDDTQIEAIIAAVGDTGIVVIDEAYQAFSPNSFMTRIAEFSNVVVMRTLSKVGMAGIRLGYLSGTPAIVNELEKVRPPYNVNVLTETTAIVLLEHMDVFVQQAQQICLERTRMAQALRQISGVEVIDSDANFLLIRLVNADLVFTKLREQKILVKNVGKMHTSLKDCLRITISFAEENNLFLSALQNALQ